MEPLWDLEHPACASSSGLAGFDLAGVGSGGGFRSSFCTFSSKIHRSIPHCSFSRRSAAFSCWRTPTAWTVSTVLITGAETGVRIGHGNDEARDDTA